MTTAGARSPVAHGDLGATPALAALATPPAAATPQGPVLTTTAVLVAVAVVVLAHRFRPRATRFDRASGAREPLFDRARRAAATLRRRRSLRAGITPGGVAEWCDRLARTIRAGETLRAALTHVEPTDPAVRIATDPVRTLLDRGRPVAEAADEPRRRRPPSRRHHGAHGDLGERGDHLDLALSVVATCGRLGGSAAAPLDRVAAALRQRAADDQERAAQSAQARLSAHVLTLVPLGVLILLVTADPAVRAGLATPGGLFCVIGGTALNAVGWMWMRRLVRGAGR